MPLIVKTTGFEEYLDSAGGAWIKALVIGAHGVGKTPTAACWPKPIIADCERGLMSVASMNIPYVTITSTEDMDALVEKCRRDSMLPPESREYLTVVIDTIDSYQRTIIQHRLRTERRESLSGWADWGWLDGKMQTLIERLVNLKMNVVVNMHYKDEHNRDGDESVLVKKARLKGDIKEAIYQDFDLIGFMETYYEAEAGERVKRTHIRWQSDPAYPFVRDRSGKLPQFTEVTFDGQDYQRIFEAITADLDALPESRTLESLAVEGDVGETDASGIPEAGTGAGPVADAKVPPAKRAAKKAPAKKAAAKKATVPDPAPETVDPWKPLDDAAAALQVKEDEPPVVIETKSPEPEPEPEPVAEEAKTVTAIRTVKVCGDQPDAFKGKAVPKPGCGRELNAENTSQSKASMLTYKTYLCNDCYAVARSA